MEKEADLRGKIEGICLKYPRYGYRPVTEQLKREGDQHGAHRQDQSTCGQLFFLYGYSRDGIARLKSFQNIHPLY